MSKLVEISQVALSTPFDNTGTGIVADNVQDAIIENAGGFSFKTIQAGVNISVPIYREMLVKQKLTVNGQLLVYGELVIL